MHLTLPALPSVRLFSFCSKDTQTHATPSNLYESVERAPCDGKQPPPKHQVELEEMTIDEIVNGQRGGGFQVRWRRWRMKNDTVVPAAAQPCGRHTVILLSLGFDSYDEVVLTIDGRGGRRYLLHHLSVFAPHLQAGQW